MSQKAAGGREPILHYGRETKAKYKIEVFMLMEYNLKLIQQGIPKSISRLKQVSECFSICWTSEADYWNTPGWNRK